MKLISLHSHKGGCGKTTIAVLLATIYARQGKKICLLDLDLPAPSIQYSVKVESKEFINTYFADLTGREQRKKNIPDYIAVHRENDLEMHFILANPEREAIERSNQNITLDLETDVMKDRIEEILEYMKNNNYDYCILDLHPGFYALSKTVIQSINTSGSIILVSTLDRSHVEGTLRIKGDLQGKIFCVDQKRIFLCMNRLYSINQLVEKIEQDVKKDKLIPSARLLWSAANIGELYGISEVQKFSEIAKIGGPGLKPSLIDIKLEPQLIKLSEDIG